MQRWVLFFIVLLFPLCSYAVHQEIPKLIVTGTATLKKPADEVRFLIGVVTQNQKADIALRANRDQMNAMVEVLKALGLTSKEYQTEQFMIEPVYSTPPKNPSPDWKASIIGYKVENKIVVRTTQLDLTAKIIDQASGAGANSVDLLEFGLHDPHLHFAEAIEAAAKNAISEAQTLAKAPHLKLKRVLEINLENVQGGKRPIQHRYFAANTMPMAYEASTPIEAGEVEITATVKLTYEIEPSE